MDSVSSISFAPTVQRHPLGSTETDKAESDNCTKQNRQKKSAPPGKLQRRKAVCSLEFSASGKYIYSYFFFFSYFCRLKQRQLTLSPAAP